MKTTRLRTQICIALVLCSTVLIPSIAAPKTMPDGTTFDAEYYADNNEDVVNVFGNTEERLYQHYTEYGRNEGRKAHVDDPAIRKAPPGGENIRVMPDGNWFDPVFYAENNPDVVSVFGSRVNRLYGHYLEYGKQEGRMPYEGWEPSENTNLSPAPAPTATPTPSPSPTPSPGTAPKPETETELPYLIYVSKDSFTIAILGLDDNGEYSQLLQTFNTAIGRTDAQTRAGSYTITEKSAWIQWSKNSYSPYGTKHSGGLWFHGPSHSAKDLNTLQAASYNKIGTRATSGCMRTTNGAAAWIYNNAPVGTPVIIANDSLYNSAAIAKVDANQKYDPSDPSMSTN